MRQVSPDGMLKVNERCEPGERGGKGERKQFTYPCMCCEARTEGGNHLRYNAAFATVHITKNHMYRRVKGPARKERCYYGI